MTLDDYLRVGETIVLGEHRFEPAEIKRFAAKYDPQPFHLDDEAARRSVLGGLCASGWHTAAMWMKLNIAAGAAPAPWAGDGPAPEFGPSPGFRDLRWLRPVMAGDTITYARRVTGHRALASRPGFRLAEVVATAHNQRGEPVLTFTSTVLLRAN